jgi:hypothetical protein
VLGNGKMAENSGSKDKALEALDFIINVLKEHEQNLDKSINELATVTEQIGDTKALTGKIEKVEEKINNLQKEVTNLIGYLSNATKEALSTAVKKQEPQTQATPTTSQAVVQGQPSVILHCRQWRDFQVLAMHAQMLSFNIKETEKVFQVNALKKNQIIIYTGALPNFSIILKTWLSQQLDTSESNILEGFLEKLK